MFSRRIGCPFNSGCAVVILLSYFLFRSPFRLLSMLIVTQNIRLDLASVMLKLESLQGVRLMLVS